MAVTLALICSAFSAGAQEDPYLWLEDVGGERSLSWVSEQNLRTQRALEAHPQFAAIRERTLEVVNSRTRIPSVQKRGAWLYNFWQDARNVRGLWRRTSLAEYSKSEPKWEVVLDLDALAKTESENWVWKGANCLFPNYERCLLSLSRGGADAIVVREFDIPARKFVQGGFELRESKGGANWLDADTLIVQTNFGENSQTISGYPRIVKEWKRGTSIEAARTIFEGRPSDISVSGFQVNQTGFPRRQFIRRAATFYTSELYLREGDSLTKLDIPQDAEANYSKGLLVLKLKSNWTTGGRAYLQGSLIVANFDRFIRGDRTFEVLFEPTDRKSLAGWAFTRNYIIVNELDNVKNSLVEMRKTEGIWRRRTIALPGLGTVSVSALDADESDQYFLTLTDYLTPSTLFLGEAGTDRRLALKALPAFFDSSTFKVEQLEATSKDGERIPYFVISGKQIKRDGTNPTLLYGYGGFEVSQSPNYSPTIGNAWLVNGGVYVVANIRGGGEFGPRWHQSGLKANRQRVFDDFIAVAEDLILRRISSPRHLAISGGSNGGLLVGAVAVQRPELFKAVVCAVPLLDMKRYHKLLAGASWVAEYGNPDDPREWEFISKYSPYQNLKPSVKYPKFLFVTSTRDDRVHPAHARKMMARMLEQGHEALYYENTEGGHAASANNQQLAYRTALTYSFLLGELK